MMQDNLNRAEKKFRSQVIAEYLGARGENRVVCFSCGNAAQALREMGLKVVEVGAKGSLQAAHWFSFNEIGKSWPWFDATPGHLPWPLMLEISKRLHIGYYELKGTIELPTGSGETLVCLKLAFPGLNIIAQYNQGPETQYNPEAPLNGLVELLALQVRR